MHDVPGLSEFSVQSVEGLGFPGQADMGPSRGGVRAGGASGKRDRENTSPRNSDMVGQALKFSGLCSLGWGVCPTSALQSQPHMETSPPLICSGWSRRPQKFHHVPGTWQSVFLSFQI